MKEQYESIKFKSTTLAIIEKAFVDRLNMFVKIKIDGKSKRKLINNVKVKKI